jgi:OOP family OmpA-OmpF porin
MNKHMQAFQAALALSSLLAAAVTAIPAQAQMTDGYVFDSRGEAVTAGGQCVQTSRWSKATANKACNPELFPAPVAAPAPRAAPAPAPAPAPVAKPAPAPKPAAKPVVMVFGEAALFAFGKAELTPAGQKALQEYREQARAQLSAASVVKISGHTDSVGSTEVNQKLSVQRAQAVRDYIVKLGGNPSIMQVEGLGESRPIADNNTAEGRAKNRRVEIEVIGTGK